MVFACLVLAVLVDGTPQAVFEKEPAKYERRPFSDLRLNGTGRAHPAVTGCSDFEIERPRPHGGKVVKATDFGLSQAHSNNAACVTRAVAYAKEIGADRVELAPGVYRCHDGEGVVVSGTKNLVIDGKGACLVFYRPSVVRDVAYWQVEISTDYGSLRLLDNERLEIRDLNVDWDWEADPLAERVRLVDTHLDDRPDRSYWEFDFIDYARHPTYPRHLPVQTLADLSEELVDGWRVRFAETGSCRYYSTEEGSHGMKMEWVSPNRARFYPRVRPDAAGTWIHPGYERNSIRPGTDQNRRVAETALKVGGLYRLGHYYVGKNCFDMLSNRHLTLENVNVHSCRGDAFHIEGAQHHWQLVNVAVWPPEDPSKAGGGPRTRPMTTTLDVMHIGCSKGWSKLVGFRCTLNQDDHANFHDRFSAVRRTGPREARITQGRGNAYFRAEVGDELDFRWGDLTPMGFTARVAAVVNDAYLRFDRDLPDELASADAFVFNRARGTDNILVKDCLYDSCWGRFLMLGHNVTFENCAWRNGIASAVLVQEGLNYGYWAEGFGAGNVVIRNCRFEALQRFNRAAFAGVVQDLFVGANLMDGYRELSTPPDPSVISGVLVEGCTFVNPRGAVWHVRNGENLVFRGNTVDLTADDPHALPYRGSVVVEGTTRDVTVTGTRLLGRGEAGIICERMSGLSSQDGVSFDFAALSEKWYPSEELGPDIVPAGAWTVGKPHVWAYPEDIPADSPIRARVGKTKALSLCERDGGHRLAHAPELADDAGSKKTASLVGTRCERAFPFSAEPGDYDLALDYSHVCEYCHGARVTAFRMRALDAKGETLAAESVTLNKSGVRMRPRQTVTIPAGTERIVLTWDLNGVGSVWFREPTLRRRSPSAKTLPPIVLRNGVPDGLDGTFCVSEGQCGAFTMEWKEGSRRCGDLDLSKVRLRFELPPCVTCSASTALDGERTVVTRREDGSTSLSVALRPGSCPKPGKTFNRYDRPFIFLMKAAAKAGASGRGSVVVELDGQPVSDRLDVRFEIVPRITAVRPKRYLQGLIAGSDVFSYDDEAAEDAMAAFAGECGVGWVIRNCPPRVCEKLRAHGVRYVSTISENFRDGYVVGPHEGIPDTDRFVPEKGKENRRPFNISVCPISVYTESEHFRTKSLPLLERQVRDYDGLWVNWELWEYGKHGCFCDRCRAAFAKFCGVGEDVVKPLWPERMVCGGEWGDRYVRFRSAESAKVVRTIDRYVRKFCRNGAGSPGFMPGIAFMQITSWRERQLAAGLASRAFEEADVHAWMPDIAVAHAWGPYPWWDTRRPWALPRESEGAGETAYFTAARDGRASMDRWYGRRRHHLTAVPQGLQGDVNVTQPEAIGLALDSFFFNGWDSSTVYFFPRGYDARHWRAFADATTRAAKYEDAVFDGRRCDGAVTLTPQAGYPAPVPKPSEYLEDRDVPMLQHAAYDHKGVRYVAAINFSWNVPAEVELRTDFADGDYEIVDEDGRPWPRNGKLVVPAARTRVFELRPTKGDAVRADAVRPRMMLRLSASNADSDARWTETRAAIESAPGCCDDVWFSTGTGVPGLDWHRANAAQLVRGAKDLRKAGIGASLQFQATIGHGDSVSFAGRLGSAQGSRKTCPAKRWTGWTGSTGVECVSCNCPRQPGFLAYLKEVSALYAEMRPDAVWIDDDLRLDNHRPATDGSRIGCWCATCLGDFNAETGGTWTREALAQAMGADAALERRWAEFSIRSLVRIAHVIAAEFHRLSPTTRVCLQQAATADRVELVRAVLDELHAVTGLPTGYRVGGGAYYDSNPNVQMLKSLESARFRKLAGDPPIVANWCCEVESWPRTYGSRSAQSILAEGFAGLMYGLDSVSAFVMAGGVESGELYAQTLLRPLADAAPVLRGYAAANVGTRVVGFAAPDASIDALYGFAREGIPVVPGVGTSLGTIPDDALKDNFTKMPSSAVQERRDGMDALARAPVLLTTPFVGLVVPRVDTNGTLRTVALLNTRIDVQGPVALALRNLPADVTSVVWRELRRPPVVLPVGRGDDGATVAIPEIGAWNGGYLDVRILPPVR